MALTIPALLAHGDRFTWDEALLVLVPIAAFAALLAVANRRANALQARRRAEQAEQAEQAGAGEAGGEDTSDAPPET